MKLIEQAIARAQYSGHPAAAESGSAEMTLEQFYTVCKPALTQERDHA